jgi:isoleucyl-tRNA synthetase
VPAFPKVSANVSFPELEAEVRALWKDCKVFERQVQERPETSKYVFYDGPPFATGLPHYGHLVASTLKDVVPRYWAMRGRRVERRFGWDTHGLPIEMLMEKQLGLSGPVSIREYGVAKFNEACRANVLQFTEEWQKIIELLGRWVDFENDYKTMDPTFMESVWWVFRQLWDKDLVYQGSRVMPYSWRLSTALSNFEANLDYRDVQDPAVTIRMPLCDEDTTLLIWTTTPWTMPSNLAIAVGEDIDYVKAQIPGDETNYVVAKARMETVLGKEAVVSAELKGADLVGKEYKPLFDYFADRADQGAFVVIPSGHVTTENGTGLVHMAPDFGEDDFNACQAIGIEILESVDEGGNFVDAVSDFAGRNVKEADSDIIRTIKAKERLFKHETIQHSYPFCWRSGTPLIYRAVPARFVKVTELRDRMVAHNKTIRWVPEAVGQKRFGNWLADARDWNVSRSRFWGTPIPVWICDDCGAEECMGSIAELEQRSGETVTDIHPHKIDHLSLTCEACNGSMQRIADVFDCWFESGAMPYAQNHYPFEGKEAFEESFPAEFIAEGLDQTRGWFYTLLVLSTALFDKPPFQNVIVNGMVLAEDGEKMSKSKQNFPPPEKVLNEYGADAVRAYLLNSPVVRADSLRFSESGVKDVVRTVLLPLRNAWSFFVQYANVDGWSPTEGLPGTPTPALADRPELDRWVMSVSNSLVRDVNQHMEAYDLSRVIPALLGFIDDLNNWYIRRSRRRFWRSAESEEARVDKASAYATMHEVLLTFGKLMAPVLPFFSEALYQNLAVEAGAHEEGKDSIHLCDFPETNPSLIDEALQKQVDWTRETVAMGRALREKHRIKIRQPLHKVTIVHHDPEVRACLERQSELISGELNVREVSVRADDNELCSLTFKANFKLLGRRMGPRMKEMAQAIAGLSEDAWRELRDGGALELVGEALTVEDVLVQREAKEDVIVEANGPFTVALDTDLDEELRAEGLAREVASLVQRMRKDKGLEITDRIELNLVAEDEVFRAAIEQHLPYITSEVLATSHSLSADGQVEQEVDVDGYTLGITLELV